MTECSPRSVWLCSTVATTGGAAGRTERALVLKTGQAPTAVCRSVMPYIIIGIIPKALMDPYVGKSYGMGKETKVNQEKKEHGQGTAKS